MSKVLSAEIVNLVTPTPPVTDKPYDYSIEDFVPFGTDNLLPQNFAAITRQSPVHRSIINSIITYVLGGGMETKQDLLLNADEESLTHLTRKLLFDWKSSGNGYIHIITDRKRSFASFYHIDYTTVRKAKDNESVIIHPNWRDYNGTKVKSKYIPLFPNFGEIRDIKGKKATDDKYLHSVYQWSNYEPEFNYYGIPDWMGALNDAVIGYKTQKWNLSRINNAFVNSGVMTIDGDFSEEQAKKITQRFLDTMTGEGNQGKVLVLTREQGAVNETKFTPVTTASDGDWKELNEQTISNLVTAHNWFRSLSGIADNTGFDTQRIMNEYQIAMNTTVYAIRKQINDMWKEIAGIEDIEYINTYLNILFNQNAFMMKTILINKDM